MGGINIYQDETTHTEKPVKCLHYLVHLFLRFGKRNPVFDSLYTSYEAISFLIYSYSLSETSSM
jgi:hypothetical protein